MSTAVYLSYHDKLNIFVWWSINSTLKLLHIFHQIRSTVTLCSLSLPDLFCFSFTLSLSFARHFLCFCSALPVSVFLFVPQTCIHKLVVLLVFSFTRSPRQTPAKCRDFCCRIQENPKQDYHAPHQHSFSLTFMVISQQLIPKTIPNSIGNIPIVTFSQNLDFPLRKIPTYLSPVQIGY